MLHIHLTVKFRMSGITFGSMKREWSLPISESYRYNLPEKTLLDFSERGVTLVVGIS